MSDAISKTQKTLLALLSKSLFGTEYTIEDDTDWKELFDESRVQAVAALVYEAAGKKLPGELKNEWYKYTLNSILQNSAIHTHHSHLHELMSKNNIDYCVLKGCSSDYYYPKSLSRAMGDVDFLVRKEDIERATKVLVNDGFTPWDKEHICHIVFRKERMHFEMHFEPAGVPDGKVRDVVLSYLEDIFDKSELVSTDSATFVKPSDFHHGLIIFLHTYHHLLAEGIGLRHLCDMAVFFNKFTNEEFTELFQQKMLDVGLWKFVQIMGSVSHKHLGIKYRDWMGNIDSDFLNDVVKDILNGGNFGAKDTERSNQGILISNRGKDGIGKKSFIQMFVTMNELAVTPFPFLKKWKVLKPFGWIFLVIRQLIRIITGKRSMIKFNGLFKAADKRKEIYKQFELFENTEDK